MNPILQQQQKKKRYKERKDRGKNEGHRVKDINSVIITRIKNP